MPRERVEIHAIHREDQRVIVEIGRAHLPRAVRGQWITVRFGHLDGARIRALRKEAGLTLEKLAYESEVGSKGLLSEVEKGLARPTVETLARIADRLEVALFDIVTFPDEDDRQRLVDRTRQLSKGTVRKLLKETIAEKK